MLFFPKKILFENDTRALSVFVPMMSAFEHFQTFL